MRMGEDECILLIRALRPFYGKKFDYVKHKNYKLTGDADKSRSYICTDHFSNEKKVDLITLSSQITKKNVDFMKSAQEMEIVDKVAISKPAPAGVKIMEELHVKDPKDIPSKYVPKRQELRFQQGNDGIETVEMN